MKLAPNAGSKNSWVWLALDAAEGEPQFEQLAIKFKLEDTALTFKDVFEECQRKLEASGGAEAQEVTEDVVKKGNQNDPYYMYNVDDWGSAKYRNL